MKRRDYHISIIVVIFVILVWFIVSNYTLISNLFLPTPQKCFVTFIDICRNGYKNIPLVVHIYESLKRLLISFSLAIITAVPIGLLSGNNNKVRAILEPIINFYRPLPPLAYYTLLVLWLGIGNESKILLLYLASFAPLYISCSQSVTKIEPNYIYNAKALGANRWQVFVTVIFPYVLPDLFSGLRTALGVGYTTLVAAEMVAARSGIGWMVLDASNYLRSDVIFVGIIIMGVTGILLDAVIRMIERFVVPWKGKNL